MAGNREDNRGPTRYTENKLAKSRPPKYAGPRKQCPADCSDEPVNRVRIIRIEAVTMTHAEYDNAVDALAVLISRWWREHLDSDTP